MRRPLVTVMLPARDAEGTLEAAARSCLDQTLGDLELLLLANDSTPGTEAVMRRLEAEDARVRVVWNPAGGGFIAALNRGWREARGEYLARMDADDWSAPERLERQVVFLERHSGLAACGTGVTIRCRDAAGDLVAPEGGYGAFEAWLNATVDPEAIAAQRFVDSPVANPSVMVRRGVFERIGGYREVAWAEDYDFWLRLLEEGPVLGKVSDRLLTWIDSESRLTRNDAHYSRERFLEAKAHFLARLEVVRERGVAIGGAGPIGKKLARLLQAEGVKVWAFLEVHPRRVGEKIGGVPVLGAAEAIEGIAPVLLGAVGRRGARAGVRAWAGERGHREGVDFFCVA